MANNISLTASMRSNLLSLQSISRQVSSTQNKLATGSKVNSAIDNPSSYYTARSLNNRANDLDALLDSMGQAVSTIKAATTALETGATFLEQAAAVATSALETNTIPAKSYFEDLVGENGAVVSTAQELKDAVNSGKETIVVYGNVEIVNDSIDMQARQKLVGINYFGNFDSSNSFSTIKTSFSGSAGRAIFYVRGADCEIANLRFEHDAANNKESSLPLKFFASAYLHDVDIYMKSPPAFMVIAAVECYNKDTKLLLSQVNILNNGEFCPAGVVVLNEAQLIIDDQCSIVINGIGDSTTALSNAHYGGKNNEQIRISSSARLFLSCNSKGSLITNNNTSSSDHQPNRVIIEKGARIAISDGTQIKYYLVKSDFESIASDKNNRIYFSDFATRVDVEEIEPWEITDLSTTENVSYVSPSTPNVQQYQQALKQYNSLIKDSAYKGNNLLKGDNLGVRFNENGSANLGVNGKDMSSEALGLSTIDWTNQGDIAQSLKEIASALKSIRAYSAELGNNYSIITSRQSFTENLINILTEGADKLTLADMNEESANMLALQTRQQLAINSLSLASQASQAVLKLF